MARRRKGLDPFDFMPLVGLALLAVFIPGGREIIQGFVGLAVWIGIFLGIALILFVGARLWLKSINDAPQVATSPSTSRPTSIRSTGFAVTAVVDPIPSLEQQLRAIDWFQFEKLMELAYAGTGTVTRKGGANPDGGIDLIVERQGERIGIQCKHWKSWTVGVKVVREMIGALADAGLKKGIIVSYLGSRDGRRRRTGFARLPAGFQDGPPPPSGLYLRTWQRALGTSEKAFVGIDSMSP